MNLNESKNITNLYDKLVDLYAGRELSEELESDLDHAATQLPELAQNMRSLRQTVNLLHNQEAPEFTEESYQRVLLKMYARGVDVQRQTPDPIHLQYQLPIQG